ncbi:Metallo-dependent phosphatase-like protein [Absidia repens]|uniref:Metallo-dependent phosphatase-like protein n=1 Tax=Absidia repens TaxID=90262 RepID=A0A1X2I074_9FUNG|nr:Metallo-dependent phosphatase-like protein [Absidia repens]
MKQVVVAWLCVILTLFCSLRACHLYWSSTWELRSAGPSWPFRHNKIAPELEQRQQTHSINHHDQLNILGDQPDGLFYFAQISDLHISKYRPKGHTLHFLQFIQSVLPIIRPEFVVVTGDLTDAKDHKRITSQQYLEEWKTYKMAIDQQPWTNTTWYDMRGNHDCFDLPSWQSRANLYRSYGQSADLVENGQGIYTWQHSPSYGEYQFVAIDACPKRGPSRPFNFFGYLTSSTMDRLASALLKPSNHTFVFSHYPTTTMVFGVSQQGYTFRDLAKHYSVYFCGHLHRLIAGLGDVLQSYDPATKTLELELGDMKDHGMYRIVAVDNDIISFVDARLPLAPSTQLRSTPLIPLSADDKLEWPGKLPMAPVILITNPKESRFVLDNKEPLHRIQSSTHIRFLVFSDESPNQMTFEILIDGKPVIYDDNSNNIDHGDDDPETVNQTTSFITASPRYSGNDKHPLWTLPWNPSAFKDGSHVLSIKVKSASGQTGKSSVIFRTDGRRTKIGGGAGEWIISTHMSTVLQCITLLSIVTMLTLLLIPRFYTDREVSERLLARIHAIDQHAPVGGFRSLQRQILVGALRCLQLPSTQPSVWYGTFSFLLALVTLPWFKAEFIPSGETPSEKFGTFYLYGMVFGTEWVPIADTWMFAAEEVCLDVGVFFALFLLHSVPSELLICGHVKMNRPDDTLQNQRSVIESPWFKGIEVLYWLWRMSEMVALASFYGGIWPTLIQNILVVWLIFVGITLGTSLCSPSNANSNGPNNISAPGKLSWMANGLDGCDGCAKATLKPSIMLDQQYQQEHGTLEPEDCHVVDLDYRFSNSSSSGSSASSTPFNRSPRAKNRKRNRHQ